MNLFILAAGVGSRLFPLTKNTPKSLIDLGEGVTLLEKQLENAINSNLFDNVFIITGYKTEQIEAKIKVYKSKIPITIIYNPFYDITNNLVSVWTAFPYMINDDFIITNGDNTYKENVFNKIISDKNEIIQLTIDYKDLYDDDDMKVKLDSNKNAVRVHKDIPLEETNAESVGLTLIKGDKSRKLFTNKVSQLVKEKEYLNKFWLEIFNSLIEDGLTIDVKEIEKNDWFEIDFHPDVDLLRDAIIKNFK